MLLCLLLIAALAQEQESTRIVTREEVEAATTSPLHVPLRILSYPFRATVKGIESGLIKFERHHMRERLQLWQIKMHEYGIYPLFGGLGEKTGFGGGAMYSIRPGAKQTIDVLSRGTLLGYQEFDVTWKVPIPRSEFAVETSYQWRPQENFFGLGQNSKVTDHSNFALRQIWTGARFEISPIKQIRFGTEYKQAWVAALAGRSRLAPSIDKVFSGVPGLGDRKRLQSTGAYVDMRFFRDEYFWEGAAHLAASYQNGLEGTNLDYFTYEVRLEGRMPIASGRSALVGQIQTEINREKAGSDPLPFYLQPHIGGSATLRGFDLDRFYGKNILLASLEYRYRIHPNFQPVIFFDEGQIFNRTSELTWLNWHRNYGFGFRMKTAQGLTMSRLEFGWSAEGFQLHLSFGDRERRALGGPIRYGAYRK